MNHTVKIVVNKRRNTAFLFETLSKDLTNCALTGDKKRKDIVLAILREYFSKGKPLHEELLLYRGIYESKHCTKEYAQKLINESKRIYFALNHNDIYNQQSQLISRVNKSLTPSPFNYFIPRYKTLASIQQMFGKSAHIKQKMILEAKVLSNMTTTRDVPDKERAKLYDNVVLKTFINNFNETYSKSLNEHQQKLLSQYVFSFQNNGATFKMYLNEEIGRIKKRLSMAINKQQEIVTDPVMHVKAKEAMVILEHTNKEKIDDDLLEKIMKFQSLIEEIEK